MNAHLSHSFAEHFFDCYELKTYVFSEVSKIAYLDFFFTKLRVQIVKPCFESLHLSIEIEHTVPFSSIEYISKIVQFYLLFLN